MQFSIQLIQRFGKMTIPLVGVIVVLILSGLLNASINFFQANYIPDFFKEEKVLSIYSNELYTTLELIAGVLFMSLFGLLLTTAIGIGIAVSFSEFFERVTHAVISTIFQIIASIPTIVYGFLMLLVLPSFMEIILPTNPYTHGILGGLVLGFMMIPLFCAKVFEIMEQVPESLREGAYALGATRYQTAFRLIIPSYFIDILIAILRTYVRTVGEILAVILVAGIAVEQTEIILLILVLTFSIVGYTIYLKRFSTLHQSIRANS